MGDDQWYFCLTHDRAEPGAACPVLDRLGPYPTREAAEGWRERVEERNDDWEAQDRAWAGDDDEA